MFRKDGLMKIRVVNIARAMALIGDDSNTIELKYLPKEKSDLHSPKFGPGYRIPRSKRMLIEL